MFLLAHSAKQTELGPQQLQQLRCGLSANREAAQPLLQTRGCLLGFRGGDRRSCSFGTHSAGNRIIMNTFKIESNCNMENNTI